MNKHTYNEIAAEFALWSDYMDPDATMTREEFDGLSIDTKIAMLAEAFGEEGGAA